MNKTILLAALSVFSLTLGASAAQPVTPAKTNNVMSLDFTLTAWPQATATPRLLALSQAAAQLSGRASGASFASIIGATDEYSPGIITGDTPVDIVDLPPDLVDLVPVDDGIPPDGVVIAFANTPTAAPRTVAATGVPFSIVSRDLVNSLNGVTNNGVALRFGNTAKLMFKQVASPRVLTLNTFGTNRQVIVREKISNRNVDTDVSRFFSTGENYVSTRTVTGEVRIHKLAALSFNSTRGLSVQLTALLTEVTAPPTTNGVATVRSIKWSAHGSGRVAGSIPNLVIGGEVATGQSSLE